MVAFGFTEGGEVTLDLLVNFCSFTEEAARCGDARPRSILVDLGTILPLEILNSFISFSLSSSLSFLTSSR